jgi:hypothetical protein
MRTFVALMLVLVALSCNEERGTDQIKKVQQSIPVVELPGMSVTRPQGPAWQVHFVAMLFCQLAQALNLRQVLDSMLD